MLPIPEDLIPADQRELWRVLQDRLRQLETPAVAAPVSPSGSAQAYSGSHAQRLSISAAKVPVGSTFFETDRTVLYMAVSSGTSARVWKYISGTMRGALSSLPTGLTANDEGFLFYSTDYYRTWRRTSSAWDYAPGERVHKEITLYPGTLPAGWALCDGGSVTISTAAAGTTSFTTPDLTGQFIRGGTYSGSVVTAVAPGVTGSTSASAATVAIEGGVPTGTASAPNHVHLWTGTVDDTGEPVHALLLPIVKL